MFIDMLSDLTNKVFLKKLIEFVVQCIPDANIKYSLFKQYNYLKNNFKVYYNVSLQIIVD